MARHLTARIGRCAALVLLLLAGCSEPDRSRPAAGDMVPAEHLRQARQEIDALRRLHLTRARQAAAELQQAARSFLSLPLDENRAGMQKAWREAHRQFVSASALPPLASDAPTASQIDAWPIEPGFLDSLPDYPDSGIVNDPTVVITAEALRSQHGITDGAEASLGFHPLEYYVFERPAADFIGNGQDETVVMRRREMLRVLTSELVGAIDALAAQSTSEPDEEISIGHLRDLVSGFRSAIAVMAEEAGATGEDAHGHRSGVSLETLQARMRSLAQAFHGDSATIRALADADPVMASELVTTAAHAWTRLRKETETVPEDLPFMLTALDKQLDLLEQRLPR